MLGYSLLIAVAQAANYPRVKEVCSSDADCFTDYEFCPKVEAESGEPDLTSVCKHKEIWELLTLEWLGCVATAVILFISNCGGLGGGGALIPICMVFFGFDTKQAIA